VPFAAVQVDMQAHELSILFLAADGEPADRSNVGTKAENGDVSCSTT
jgi:hypothetical protein